MPWRVSDVEVGFENLTFFFLGADVGVTQSFELFFNDILIRCRVREYRCRIVDANVRGVLPREVAQAATVPTTLVSRSLVGRCRQGAASVFILCLLGWTDPEHNWKPSQHACSFRGYLRDNHRTNGLSTLLFNQLESPRTYVISCHSEHSRMSSK